jgi:stage IV sporulation protein FB
MEQTNYWQLGKWWRIPVAMHWTMLLAFAWMYLIFWSVPATLIGALAYFVLAVVHEAGHVAVLRRKKIVVERVTLYGLHGETTYAYAKPLNEIQVAWGGVAAQLLLLLLSLAAYTLLPLESNWLLMFIAGPILLVWTKLNVFLMLVALLPIGPFDGRAAWAVIPYWRAARKRRQRARVAAQAVQFTPEQLRVMEEDAAKEAAALLKKLGKPMDSGKQVNERREDV